MLSAALLAIDRVAMPLPLAPLRVVATCLTAQLLIASDAQPAVQSAGRGRGMGSEQALGAATR